MKRVFLFSFISIFYVNCICSQVSLCPEIGLNYKPYILRTSIEEFYMKTPECFINVVGETNITSNLFFQARIGYIFRNDIELKDYSSWNREYQGIRYINNEMNCSIAVLSNVYQNFRLGLGAGFIHKLNSSQYAAYTYGNWEFPIQSYLYNAHVRTDYKIKDLYFVAAYEFFFNGEVPITNVGMSTGRYAVSLGVGYQLFKGRSKK